MMKNNNKSSEERSILQDKYIMEAIRESDKAAKNGVNAWKLKI